MREASIFNGLKQSYRWVLGQLYHILPQTHYFSQLNKRKKKNLVQTQQGLWSNALGFDMKTIVQ